jgi:leader peptidase (prepilin peptidase)/N-methyltransferase
MARLDCPHRRGFAGFLFAAVYGITQLVSGRATRNHQIPFGPFVIAGAFLVTLAMPGFT